MASQATMTVKLTEVDGVRQFIEKMTAVIAYTSDLEQLFAGVKNDPRVCSNATANECIATLREKHGVVTLPFLGTEEW